jgi:hypothetical protein
LRLSNTDGMARFVEPSTTGFALAAPSEKPLWFSIGTGAATIGAAEAEEEGLLVRAVMGLSFAGRATLLDWPIKGSTLKAGVVDLDSEGDGEGGFLALSHCPMELWEIGRCRSRFEGFSPLTSSSSPLDTGAFARGELRSGRVRGLPEPTSEAECEFEGSVGVGCSKRVCNDNDS